MTALSMLRALAKGLRHLARQLTPSGWLVVAFVIAGRLLVVMCAENKTQEARRDRRDLEAAAVALSDGRKADTAAAEERLWEVKLQQPREKELTDAVQSLPDAEPSPVQRRLACQRLRQQGTRAEDIPAYC